MGKQETSREAFHRLCIEGKLVGKQRLIMAELVEIGPATSGEVLASLRNKPDGPPIDNVNAWRARFTELAARGLIREGAPRKCRVTGFRSIVWTAVARAKPLHVKKGSRAASTASAKEWRGVAARLAELLGDMHETIAHSVRERIGNPDDRASALADYHKLAGAR